MLLPQVKTPPWAFSAALVTLADTTAVMPERRAVQPGDAQGYRGVLLVALAKFPGLVVSPRESQAGLNRRLVGCGNRNRLCRRRGRQLERAHRRRRQGGASLPDPGRPSPRHSRHWHTRHLISPRIFPAQRALSRCEGSSTQAGRNLKLRYRIRGQHKSAGEKRRRNHA
jgi:hypothetical protein